MALIKKSQRPSAREVLPPLLLGALGSAGVIALYHLVPDFQPIELVLLLVVTGFVAIGYNQGTVRGIATVIIIYFATGVAATLYRVAAPYVNGIMQIWSILWQAAESAIRRTPMSEVDLLLGGAVSRNSLAVSFGLLAMTIWGALEIASRGFFEDTRLPLLGVLDNLGGVIVYLAVGVLVASLLFNTLGYGSLRRAHNKAMLRPRFNQVLYAHYTTQSFWFPRRPPAIYIYDLDLPRRR